MSVLMPHARPYKTTTPIEAKRFLYTLVDEIKSAVRVKILILPFISYEIKMFHDSPKPKPVHENFLRNY